MHLHMLVKPYVYNISIIRKTWDKHSQTAARLLEYCNVWIVNLISVYCTFEMFISLTVDWNNLDQSSTDKTLKVSRFRGVSNVKKTLVQHCQYSLLTCILVFYLHYYWSIISWELNETWARSSFIIQLSSQFKKKYSAQLKSVQLD